MRHAIHEGSKVRATTALRFPLPSLFDLPHFSLHTRRISDFLASSRGPNLGRSFDVPLPSQRGHKSESEHEVLDFEFVGIPALQFRYGNFHRFLKQKIAFSFPCSKTSVLEEM
ncbi:hypothetical protein AVEN_182547-1 [Araneus ventricosus]|uniref:Uncharacterized protein n=1 Tax=Araneus ventricosus TaxID=182803 RepID=A0A4Y2BXK4_ARAVE|nr:hypothetical protein AVEN_182547-1 [Araneus ventricosus]